jgi:putative membrane protein
MNVVNKYSERTWLNLIAGVSLLVVLIVAFLFYNAQPAHTGLINPKVYFLPKLNAFINGSVAILLSSGFYFIRRKNVRFHRACMVAAFTFSIVFLVSYILYHFNAVETRYGDLDHDGVVSKSEQLTAGSLRYIYYFVLGTHIMLSTIIIPMVLVTLYRILKGDIQRHRKIARWTFPLWLYVSVTGVAVYFLISQYYPV